MIDDNSTTGTDVNLTNTQVYTASSSQTVAAPTQQVQTPVAMPTIHVKITDRLGTIDIDMGSPINLPSKATIIELLPTEHKRLLQPDEKRASYYTLTDIITNHRRDIPLQVWADTIAEAAIRGVSCAQNEAEAKVFNPAAAGAYLAWGDELYKLTAVGVLSANRALTPLRKRILDTANTQALAIMENAQQAAKTLVESATKKRNQADEYLKRAQRQNTPSDIMFESRSLFRMSDKHSNFSWEVGVKINFSITQILYVLHGQEYKFSPKWDLDSIPILLWVPFDPTTGEYIISSIYVDRDYPVLPHITYHSACMSPGMAPKVLKDSESISRLKHAIERCLSTVDLTSLYTSYQDWDKKIRAFIPERIQQILAEKKNWSIAFPAYAKELLTGRIPNQTETPIFESTNQQIVHSTSTETITATENSTTISTEAIGPPVEIHTMEQEDDEATWRA